MYSAMPSKIIFISNDYGDSGSPHQLMAAIYLNKIGINIEVVCPGKNLAYNIVTPFGTIPSLILKYNRSLIGRILWHIRLFRILLKDRVSYKNNIYYLQGHVVTLVSFFALFMIDRARVVYHTQDYLEPGRHPFWAFFEKHIARYAGHVICNEPNRARFMASNYRLKTMPTTVRTALPRDWPIPERSEELREALLRQVSRTGNGLRLVMVQGFLGKLRGGPQIVEAVASLPENYILVTTATRKDSADYNIFSMLAKNAGIFGRIIFLPTLEYGELLRYTSVCDIGMMLYPNDGVGNYYQAPGKLTEFMRCGLPVVTSNFPGLELLTLKYGIGIVCDPESPAAIMSAILMLGNRSEDEMLVERIRLKELAISEFAYETHAWQIEEIINNIQGEL